MASYQKHLGILLDETFNFKQHIDSAILKITKGIYLIKELRHSLPQISLVKIYKDFFRPIIAYRDTIYIQSKMDLFLEN